MSLRHMDWIFMLSCLILAGVNFLDGSWIMGAVWWGFSAIFAYTWLRAVTPTDTEPLQNSLE